MIARVASAHGNRTFGRALRRRALTPRSEPGSADVLTAAKTVRNIITTLRRALSDAVEDGLL